MPDVEIIVEGTETARATEVKEKIEVIRANMHEGLFDLAELLAEARTKSFHLQWGYTRFGDWIENGSGLDLSERTAYYLINIVNKAQELGIPRENLRLAKMSKLKEIFSLDESKFGPEMRLLVEKSKDASLEEIREEVQKIKVGEGEDTYVFMTLKVPKTVKEKVIDTAFELVRRQYGDVVDPKTGEKMDLSDSRCIEFVCVNYVEDPNNNEEIQEEEE